jgi:hypothetical protein
MVVVANAIFMIKTLFEISKAVISFIKINNQYSYYH